MGGMAAVTGLLGIGSAAGNIASGKAEKRAYESEAQQATLQGEMDAISRKRELEDALSMQAVMFASQGRQAGVGSALAIQEEDIRRSKEDIRLIKAGASATSSAKKLAGRYTERAGLTSAIMGTGKSMLSLGQAGAFEGAK